MICVSITASKFLLPRHEGSLARWGDNPPEVINSLAARVPSLPSPGVVEALQGLKRVLKPDGQFIFFEHGLAPDPQVRRWQRRMEPFFKLAFEGCHVTRHIPTLLEDGRFRIEQLQEAYLAPFPKSGSYCFWGVARHVS